MRLALTYLVAGGIWLFNMAARADEDLPSAPLGTPPIGEQVNEEQAIKRPQSYYRTPDRTDNAASSIAPEGRQENRWRYRYFQGRWWYWTAANQWSYFNGSRWTTYRTSGDYLSKKVDPALLRLEAKEGTLGAKRWPHVGGGGSQGGAAGSAGQGYTGLPLSGTSGSIGGAPSGPFTFSPGVPNSINTNGPRGPAGGQRMRTGR
jgi:hypothetical protein